MDAEGDDGIEVILESTAWRAAVPRAEDWVRRAVNAALDEAGMDGAVTVLLSDNRSVKGLNGRHRGKVKPTNVLSFPSAVPGQLGDIALAFGVVKREARQGQRRIAVHLAHLVAHGTLHLCGYDHIQAGDARRMEQAEARIMCRLGLPNPWRGVS
ncbi:rRNA maturation RNase YbeY [Acetobacteraceae bacterium H6797]|nr:rRNA maturation RNase YbeY [Acetobacteraceae bacterium H6797]